MTLKFRLLLLFLAIMSTIGLSAQTLKGEIFNREDSLPIMFANLTLVDSLGNFLKATSTNDKGEFVIQTPKDADIMKIFQLPDFAELQIVNLNQGFSDTLNLGRLPMIKAPPYLQVQYKEMSKRKERNNQKQIIKSYNQKVNNYDDLTIKVNNQVVRLNVKSIKQERSERLKLIYVLDFEILSLID